VFDPDNWESKAVTNKRRRRGGGSKPFTPPNTGITYLSQAKTESPAIQKTATRIELCVILVRTKGWLLHLGWLPSMAEDCVPHMPFVQSPDSKRSETM
jgi:hypothetical protein